MKDSLNTSYFYINESFHIEACLLEIISLFKKDLFVNCVRYLLCNKPPRNSGSLNKNHLLFLLSLQVSRAVLLNWPGSMMSARPRVSVAAGWLTVAVKADSHVSLFSRLSRACSQCSSSKDPEKPAEKQAKLLKTQVWNDSDFHHVVLVKPSRKTSLYSGDGGALELKCPGLTIGRSGGVGGFCHLSQ